MTREHARTAYRSGGNAAFARSPSTGAGPLRESRLHDSFPMRSIASFAALVLVACGSGTERPSLVTSTSTTAGATAARACAYVTNWGGDDVCAVIVPEGRSRGCVRTGPKPHGIALSRDGARVFVSNEGANTVTAIDATSLRVIGEVPVGRNPNQIALSPAGDHLWVTNNGDDSVTVVDTATLGVVRTIPVGRAPHIIVTNAARNAAMITSEGDGALDLYDLSSFERIARVPVFGYPRVVAATRTGDVAFLTVRWLNGALVVDLLGKGPRDRVALGEVRFAKEGKDAHGIALASDERTLLITTQMTDRLTFVDTTTLEVRGGVTVGRNPNWVEVTPDGRLAVVSNTDDDSLSIVDITERRVLGTVRVGKSPKRLAVGPCAKEMGDTR